MRNFIKGSILFFLFTFGGASAVFAEEAGEAIAAEAALAEAAGTQAAAETTGTAGTAGEATVEAEATAEAVAGTETETESQDTQAEAQNTQAAQPQEHLISLGAYRITAYCEGRCCNGKWAGRPTASGTSLTAGRTIAVDRRVIPLGSRVKINIPGIGWQTYIAEDTGGAIKGNRIDIFVHGHSNTYDPRFNTVAEVALVV